MMVVKDEADNYLDAALSDMRAYTDAIFVFDDQSTDRSAAIAQRHAVVSCRSDHDARGRLKDPKDRVPSFMEDEGAFREESWREFEHLMQPEDGDWVVSLDADEFLLGTDRRARLEEAAHEAARVGTKSISTYRREAFSLSVVDGTVVAYQPRLDGFWHSISGGRIFRYETNGSILQKGPGGEVRKKPMGCGSSPTYARQTPPLERLDFTVLHLGYATAESARVRYDRYTSLKNHGHAQSHIDSIVAPPHLGEEIAMTVPVWMGEA